MRILHATAPFVLIATLGAQTPTWPELSVNNTARVVSGSTHPQTGNRMPASSTYPPGYGAQPGVAAGTRAWTHTPQPRAEAGSQGSHLFTVRGMTQAIFVGPGCTQFPNSNHYQFKTGMAASQPSSRAPAHEHHPTKADVFSIQQAALPVGSWALIEHSISLTTPIRVAKPNELFLFVEFKGGEYVNDTNGGQTVACDYRGGWGPKNIPYCGWTTGQNPRVNQAFQGTGYHFRPKIGLIVEEPVLTMTGNHANWYTTPVIPNETYRGVGAARAAWATYPSPNLFFDVRAGAKYGSSGSAVVFLNVSRTYWSNSIPYGTWGNFLLNPNDPALGVIAAIPFTLQAGGVFNGKGAPFTLSPFGYAARGTYLKAQGIVFNTGAQDLAFTTASGMIIE